MDPLNPLHVAPYRAFTSTVRQWNSRSSRKVIPPSVGALTGATIPQLPTEKAELLCPSLTLPPAAW